MVDESIKHLALTSTGTCNLVEFTCLVFERLSSKCQVQCPCKVVSIIPYGDLEIADIVAARILSIMPLPGTYKNRELDMRS